MLRKNKKKFYYMNMDQANETLQNVFAACEKAPNTVPFDKLVLRQKLNTRIYDRLIILTAFLLLISFSSPLAVTPVNAAFNRNRDLSKITVDSDYEADGILYLNLIGDSILYDQAYQITADGIKEFPVSYDEKCSTICFPYHPDKEVNIYIPSSYEQSFHLLVTPMDEN
ncbi:MAG TPA: hypothetical protein VJY54_13355 [Lachnospiraceae bacterium]|nr:hypothetical protein [Lachnospiraceae bacterium]